jgi:5,10-methenyltetrahydrofolate synthetase
MPNVDLKPLRNRLLRERTAHAQDPSASSASQAVVAALNHALTAELQSLGSIALYWPIQQEIDLRRCLIDWAKAQHGRELALPVMRADKQLDFYAWREGDELVSQRHGISEPNPKDTKIQPIEPDCILIPCVGWSWDVNTRRDSLQMHYWRLGYGGGYFDRTLAHLRAKRPSIVCIGVAHDWQQLSRAQWQPEAHDEPLDAMLTESGLRFKGD